MGAAPFIKWLAVAEVEGSSADESTSETAKAAPGAVAEGAGATGSTDEEGKDAPVHAS